MRFRLVAALDDSIFRAASDVGDNFVRFSRSAGLSVPAGRGAVDAGCRGGGHRRKRVGSWRGQSERTRGSPSSIPENTYLDISGAWRPRPAPRHGGLGSRAHPQRARASPGDGASWRRRLSAAPRAGDCACGKRPAAWLGPGGWRGVRARRDCASRDREGWPIARGRQRAAAGCRAAPGCSSFVATRWRAWRFMPAALRSE